VVSSTQPSGPTSSARPLTFVEASPRVGLSWLDGEASVRAMASRILCIYFIMWVWKGGLTANTAGNIQLSQARIAIRLVSLAMSTLLPGTPWRTSLTFLRRLPTWDTAFGVMISRDLEMTTSYTRAGFNGRHILPYFAPMIVECQAVAVPTHLF
jgi:hypothetical protein